MSCTYTPHQNGIAKKKIGHIMGKPKALLLKSEAHETQYYQHICRLTMFH